MIHLKKYALISLVFFSLHTFAQKCVKLKPTKSVSIAVSEPSDICYNPKTDTFYIASDSGFLTEVSHDGKVIRQVAAKNADYEAVYADDQAIYAVDESHRNICFYDYDFKKTRTVNVPYSGGRNKGYEAFTFNKSKNIFIIITEKDPITVFELDANFKPTNQIDLSSVASDISSATYHNGALWLLSDESMMILKLNPITYEVLQKWSIPVINPEGFAFDKDGNLLVTCDDMQRMYYFNNPEKN